MSQYHPTYTFKNQSIISNDIDEFNEIAKPWDRKGRKLNKGNEFEAGINLINTNDFELAEISLQGIVEQTGAQPNGKRSFLIPGNDHQSFYWRKNNINGNQIGMYPLNSEMAAISNSGFNVFVISVPESKIIEKAAKMQFDWTLLNKDFRKDLIIVDHNEMRHLRQKIRRLFNLKRMSFHTLHLNLLFEDLTSSLLEQLILIFISLPDRYLPDKSNRLIIFQKTRDYIFSNPRIEFSSDRLCEYVAASERSLQYAVKYFTGLTPLEYAKSHKLNRIREELLKSEPNQTKVSELAFNYGFWHLSQFAKDYRNLFGEQPSKTLKGK